MTPSNRTNQPPGTMDGKEAFMHNIARRLGRSEPLAEAPAHPAPGVPPHYADIRLSREEQLQLFVRSWTALTGRALVVREDEAAQAIGAYLEEAAAEHGVSSVAMWEHDGLAELGLDRRLRERDIAVVPWREDGGDTYDRSGAAGTSLPAQDQISEAAAQSQSGGANWSRRSPLLRAVERCQLGIVWADFAVANTGTLVLLAEPGRGRSVSLLPGILFAVFRADQLVTRMGEAFAAIREQLPEALDLPPSINLITGPSRSADIENDLTIGVHGPGIVYSVIIDS